MTFSASTTPDITEDIPLELARRVTNAISSERGVKFDVVIGGIGFAIDPGNGSRLGSNGPYVRQSIPIQKQQTDTSSEPGEQSLDGFWIRSQNSWHRGAGINFYEPGSEKDTEYRFTESSGVDVWTPGQMTALHKMTNVSATATPAYVMNAGPGYVVYLSDTAVLGWDSASYTLNTPAIGHTGRYYFFGYKNYYKVGWSGTPSPTVGVWNGDKNTVIAGNASVEPKLWYCKDRLIVAHGANLFEVPPDVSTAVDLSAAASALHAPKDTNTSWVDIVEGPAAIYAGYAGGIVRFALEAAASGQTPKLSQAFRVLELPAGETLKSMYGYLGRFLILSTSVGIRVAAIDGQGNLTMGQVSVKASLGDFRGMSADGDIVYIAGAKVPVYDTTGGTNIPGWGESSGLLALNLGQPLGDGSGLLYAYALDETATVTGTTTSCLVIDGTKYLAINTSGIWKTHADYVAGGYLAMGRVRYNTLVRKVYHSLDLIGSLGTGTLKLDLRDENEAVNYSVTMDPTTGVFETVGLDLTETHSYLRPVGTFTWTSGSAPVLNLLQLRALPSPKRMRQVRYPLQCNDRAKNRNGVDYGQKGFAFQRLAGLEQLEATGVPVTIIDYRNDEQYTAIIDEVQFTGKTAPDKQNDNFGGTLQLTVTKLT